MSDKVLKPLYAYFWQMSVCIYHEKRLLGFSNSYECWYQPTYKNSIQSADGHSVKETYQNVSPGTCYRQRWMCFLTRSSRSC